MTSHRHTYRLSLSLVLFLTPAAWAAQAQVDLIDQIKTANERDNRYDELSEAVWKKKSTALSRVVDLLESESGEERDNATKILAILQRKANFNLSKKSISRIIVLIEQNDDPGLRCQLLNLIGRTKTDGVELLPVLIKLIGSENDTVRRAAIEAIQGGTSDEKQTSKTIDLLLKALDNEDAPSIRVAAALALGRIGRHGEKVVPALTQRLSDNYLKVRDASTGGLKPFKKDAAGAIPRLVKMLETESDYNIRAHSICALSTIADTDPEVFNRVYSYLDDGQIRLAVLCHLYKFGPVAAPAVPRMIELMKSDDHYLRQRALLNLAYIGPAAKDALPLIKNEIRRGDKESVRMARFALKNISDDKNNQN